METRVKLRHPIFIVSIFRTGSTLLTNILNANSFIAMIPEEIHLWNPYPWAFDVMTLCKTHKISNERDIEMLIDKLFSERVLYGGFWKKLNKFELKKERVTKNAIKIYQEFGEISCIDIVNLVFLEFLSNTDKIRIGGKNPVYGRNVELLNTLYPDSKIICLVRDPRAIYLSKTNDEFSREVKSKLRWKCLVTLFDFATLVRIILEYTWLFRTCKSHKNDENVILTRYEDIVTSPRENLKKLCQFLDVPFEKDMLYVTGKPSSIDNKTTRRSIDPKSAYKWRKKIKPWQYWILTEILHKSIEWFGYPVKAYDSYNNDD
ncbi:hypothetical protein CL1_0832 [Thermococcus cleftensis]|uniref:Sulfotransferase n=1 Tax=Thermococcus cleftensis (strain DSM 27260 / KACC 17922 / CL1) TaxID=163003 RepID=I3ZTK3_THECF|nr:sulfotransferase [Thermococcus cleftensis]AFL95037.1 hypothetical protein CL1_0832 [Thermococcus cleftensis]